mmetsp:Transcript_50100/g.144334  ORF Transcript_50100/g.144334 Transcript_50100/m.144334 type:complete len:220 (-) Transcript_50100:2079-2738(-)
MATPPTVGVEEGADNSNMSSLACPTAESGPQWPPPPGAGGRLATSRGALPQDSRKPPSAALRLTAHRIAGKATASRCESPQLCARVRSTGEGIAHADAQSSAPRLEDWPLSTAVAGDIGEGRGGRADAAAFGLSFAACDAERRGAPRGAERCSGPAAVAAAPRMPQAGEADAARPMACAPPPLATTAPASAIAAGTAVGDGDGRCVVVDRRLELLRIMA